MASLSSSQSDTRGRAYLNGPRTLNSDASPTRGSKRSITVDVVEGHQLRNPITKQHVVQPTIHIGFGKGSSVTPIGRSHQNDRFRFEHRTELAYNGESVLRFLLVDGVLQLGFKDIPIDDSVCPETWKGPVTLMSRHHGSCGTIEVLIQKTNRKVLPGWLKAPEVVPVHPAADGGAGQHMSVDKLDGGKTTESHKGAAEDYTNAAAKHSNFRSCRLTLLRAEGLTTSDGGSAPENPYVNARFGKHELRTAKVASNSEEVPLNQVMVFPYEHNKYLQLDVRDDRKQGAKDPLCGSSVVDMERYLFVGERRVDLPVANKSGAPGKIQALIEFREEQQKTAHVEPVAGTHVRRTESSESVASSSSSAYRRKVAAVVGVNSVKLQLIDTEDDLSQKPYVMAMLTDDKLRSSGEMKTSRFNETFVFPYSGQKYMRVVAHRDLKMRKDPIMGRARLDLEPYVGKESNSDVIMVPLVDEHRKRIGNLRVRVSTSRDNVSKCYVLSEPVPSDAPRSSSDVSSHEALLEPSALQRSDVGSIHCRPIAVKDLKPEKPAKMIRPYVKCQFGDTMLEGSSDRSATAPSDGTYPLSDRFILPYKPYKKVSLMAYNDISMSRDVCLGKCEVDLDEWQQRHRKRETFEVPLVGAKGGKTGIMQLELELPSTSVDKAQVQTSSTHTHDYKSYRVLVRDARNLVEPSSKINKPLSPYVEISNGAEKALTSTQTRAGANPTFQEAFEMPVTSHRDLVFKVYDATDPKKPEVIGSATVAPDTLKWQKHQETDHHLTLRNAVGKETGTLRLSAVTSDVESRRLKNLGKANSLISKERKDEMPAKKEETLSKQPAYNSFDIVVENCRDLQNPKKAIDTLDPYVIIRHGEAKLQTAVMKNAGDNPDFNERFRFPLTEKPQKLVYFDVYDKAHIVKDPLLGSATIDIAKYDSRTKVPLSVKLTYKKKAAGILNCMFVGSKDDCSIAQALGRETKETVEEKGRATASQLVREDDSLVSSSSEDLVTKPPVPNRVQTEHTSFRIKLVNARNLVNPKAKIDTLDPYVKITHGDAKVTSIVRKNAGDNPDFNELFQFPTSTITQVIKFDVYDQAHVVADPLLGSGEIMTSVIRLNSEREAAVQLFDKKGKAAGTLNVEFSGSRDQVTVAKSLGVQTIMSRSTSSASVPDLTEIRAPIHRNHQSFFVTVKNGRQLTSTRPGNALDPVVTLMHGNATIETIVAKQGGTDPDFYAEKFIFPTSPKSQTLTFEVRDAGGKTRDTIVGVVSVPLERFPDRTHDPKAMSLELLDKRGNSAGFLNVEVETLPTSTSEAKGLGRGTSPRPVEENLSQIIARSVSGSSGRVSEQVKQIKVDQKKPEPSMTEKARVAKTYRQVDVIVDRAEHLVPPKHHGESIDPFLVVKHGDYKVKTSTKKNAGLNPQFNEIFNIPTTDKKYVLLEVHDNAHIGPDPLLGKCFLDLDSVVVKEGQNQQFALPLVDKTGTDAGTLYFGVYPGGREIVRESSSPGVIKKGETGPKSQKESIYKGVQLDIVKVADLVNPKSDKIDTLDPYCIVRYGNESIKGTVHSNGGKSCSIDDTFYFPYQSYQYLRVDVHDRAHITKDALLGSTRINLDNYCADPVSTHKMKIPLLNAKGATGSGFVFIKLVMLENHPGQARVVHNASKSNAVETDATTPSPTNVNRVSSAVSEASSSTHGATKSLVHTSNKCVQIDLLNSFNLIRSEKESSRDLNPYVMGRVGGEKLRSRTVSGGEECASYQETMHFIYSGERKVKLEVWDDYKAGKDTLVGYSKIDLDPIVVNSRNEIVTCHLYNPKTNKETGTLCVRIRARPEMIGKSYLESNAEAIKSSSCIYESKAVHFEHLVLSDAIVPMGFESLNPYPLVEFGGRSLRGKTVNRSDGSAVFHDRFSFSTQNGSSQACLSVYDNRRHAVDTLVGKGYVNVHDLLRTGPPRQIFEVPLLDKKGNFSGFLRGTLAADNSKVTDNAHVHLGEETTAKLDYKSVRGQILEFISSSAIPRPTKPYVEATLANQDVRLNHPGDPHMHEEFEFPYKSNDTLKLELRDDLKMKRDPRLGVGLLRVDEALRTGGANGQTIMVPVRDSKNCEVANIGVLLRGSNSSVPKGRVLRSKVGGTPQTVVEPESKIKSFTGQVVAVSGLPVMKKPYVMFNSGKYEIRLPHGTKPDTKEYFECPYKLNEAATIRLMDDLKFKRDPTLGTGELDLEDILELKGAKKVTVSLESNGSPAGSITFLFTSYDKELPHARVITPTQKTRALEDLSSEESSEEEVVEDLRTSTIMTATNSFTCQLIDYTPPENAKMKRPYIISTYGKDKLRTEHLFLDQTTWRETVLEYPYQNLKSVNIELRDDLKMKRDPIVGTGSIDLDSVINNSKPVTITVPLSKGGEVVYLFNGSSAKLSKARIYTKKETADASTAPSNIKSTAVTAIMIEVVNGKDLLNPKEPFLTVQFAKNELKGMAQKKGGANPEFYDDFTFPYEPYRFIRIRVNDKTSSTVVGESTLDLDNLINKHQDLQRISIPLYNEGKTAGLLNCRLHLDSSLPAKEVGVHQRASLTREPSAEVPGDYLTSVQRYKALHLTIHRLEDIPDVDAFGAMDPYVKTQLGKLELVSDVFEDAGTTVDIHTTFSFPYNQERYVKLAIFDANKVRGDKNAGEAVFDLTSFIEGDQLKALEGANVVLPMTYKGKTHGSCIGVLRMQRDPIPQPCTLKATYGATITE